MPQPCYLDSDDALSPHEADGLHLLPHDDARRQGNQIHAQSLGDKRKGARDADVALDHLQLVVLR